VKKNSIATDLFSFSPVTANMSLLKRRLLPKRLLPRRFLPKGSKKENQRISWP
jgi:hypothetical protein